MVSRVRNILSNIVQETNQKNIEVNLPLGISAQTTRTEKRSRIQEGKVMYTILTVAQAPFRRDIKELPEQRNFLLVALVALMYGCGEAEAKEDYGCQNFVNLLGNVVTGERQDFISFYGNAKPDYFGDGRLARDEVVTRLEFLAFDYFHDAPRYDGADKSRVAYQLWAAAYATYHSYQTVDPGLILDGRVSAKVLAGGCADDGYKTEHDPVALIHYINRDERWNQ